MAKPARLPPDLAAATTSVLATYRRDMLAEACDSYRYKFQHSPDDDRRWGDFRKRGFMTVEELADLSRWKTKGRQDQNIARNSDQAVCAVTRAATSVAGEVPDEPALPIGTLTALHGVDIPTASTVMTVWNPERFGILDVRVWTVLRRVVPSVFPSIESVAGNRRVFRLDEVDVYIRVIREIAAQTSLSCRAIDKALWVLGADK